VVMRPPRIAAGRRCCTRRLSNIQEVRARGAPARIVIAEEGEHRGPAVRAISFGRCADADAVSRW